MFVYTFSPSALNKNNIINWRQNACWRHRKNKKNAPSAKFPPMFVYTFSPSALKKNNNIINWCQNACWRHRKNQKFCAFGEISPYVCLNSFWKYFYWRNIIISLCNKYDARRRRQNFCVFTRSLCFFHPWKLSRLSEYVLEITKNFLGLPAQIFKILVRMLNYRSNSEKPLNYQDLQEGGGTPPPTQ